MFVGAVLMVLTVCGHPMSSDAASPQGSVLPPSAWSDHLLALGYHQGSMLPLGLDAALGSPSPLPCHTPPGSFLLCLPTPEHSGQWALIQPMMAPVSALVSAHPLYSAVWPLPTCVSSQRGSMEGGLTSYTSPAISTGRRTPSSDLRGHGSPGTCPPKVHL